MPEEHGLEMVYACKDDEEAEIIVGYLNSNGIEANIDSDLPHITFPVEDDSKIYVNRENAAQARELLAARNVEGAESLVDEDTLIMDAPDSKEEEE